MTALRTFLCAVAMLVSAEAPARMQQPARSIAMPAGGEAVEQSLEPGAFHEWYVELAASEYVEATIEPIGIADTDAWPAITVVGPGERVLFESADPSVSLGIDSSGVTIASFVSDRPGQYRVRVAAGAAGTVPLRYRVQMAARRPTVDPDQPRLSAHRLWREGGALITQRSPASLKASAEKFDAALQILASIDDREGQAITLTTLADLSYQLSDAARGKSAVGRAIEIWTALGREREEAQALSDRGLLAYATYDHASAHMDYDKALTMHRAAGDVLSEARTLTRIGWVNYAAAELQKVIDVNRDALLRYRQAGNTAGESIAFNDLGRAYLDLGEVSEALDSFQQALALRPAERYARGAANVLIRIGLVYLSVAEWQRALDVLQQARALARRAQDTRTEITTLVNLGSAYVTLGDTAEGFRYLEPALTLARSIEFRGAESYALLWLGIGASLTGDPARSRDFLQQAIAIQAAIKDVRGQATSTRQLAAVQLELGAPREALDSIARSIEISPRGAGLIYTGTLTLANVYAALGDKDKARAQYEEALTRFRDVRARHAEALALSRLGRFEAKEQRFSQARELLEQAITLHESLRGLLVDPDLRMSYASTSLAPYQLFVDVLMESEHTAPGNGFAAAAFHTNERARARGLLDMLATSGVDVHEGVDTALVERERSQRWNLNAKAALQTSLLAGKRDEKRLAALETEIATLSRDWRATTTEIRQQSPAYASLTQPQPLTTAEVSELLDGNTVLLEFAPGEARSWLFALTRASVDSFALPSRQDIDIAARDVHRLLTSRQPVRGESTVERQARIAQADAELVERSRALSNLVLGPIAGKLDGEWREKRLAIVAGGALEYVPFGALPVPGDAPGGPRPALVAAHEIVTLPSASSLAFLRKQSVERRSAQKTIAILADPVFAADDPRVRPTPVAQHRAVTPDEQTRSTDAGTQVASADIATRAIEPFQLDGTRGSLARLPFSRAEATAVAAQVPRASLLQATDFDATLELVTSGRLNDYRIVHFATHGLINTSRPELSGLALSLVDRDGRRRDGFLRLNTIYNLRLSADLVVLSACQTALGKEVAGEGLVGLTRGFMYAGARRVIASLWQVSDVATAELMKRFYDGLLQRHLPAAAALRRAQMEMARDPRWASPYYWAGFVLQGDWQ